MTATLILEVIRILARYLAALLAGMGMTGTATLISADSTINLVVALVLAVATEAGWIKARLMR
jgi:hypothetical protein